MSQTIIAEVTDSTLTEEIADHQVPVLVVFHSPDSQYSTRMTQLFEQLAEENRGKARVCLAPLAHNRAAAEQFQIRKLPTFLLFKDGEVVERIVGPVTRQLLQVMVGKHV